MHSLLVVDWDPLSKDVMMTCYDRQVRSSFAVLTLVQMNHTNEETTPETVLTGPNSFGVKTL